MTVTEPTTGSRPGNAPDSGPLVVLLGDAGTGAADAPPAPEAAIGRKAAALARARRSGLPVLPGVVLTAAGAAAPPDSYRAQLAAAVAELPEPWIVRSSSPDEDGEESSQAGRFTSVRDVTRGSVPKGPGHADGEQDGLFAAVAAVVASGDAGPMAVLIQPQREFALSGVLFGVDPVTGAPGMVVAVTAGSPDGLVSGTEDGVLLTLGPRGVFRREGTRVRSLFGFRTGALGRALARLARDAARLFGGPQDIEWGWSPEEGLVLLQSRPVTKVAAAVAKDAVVLGAGPLAETFPVPLWPLEEDLWLPPLSAGLEAALRRSGAARAVRSGGAGRQNAAVHDAYAGAAPWDANTLVRSVGGQPVVRLSVFGGEPRARGRMRSLVALVDPRPGARRLRVAWRVGRLRTQLPDVAADLVRNADALLVGVPPAQELTDAQLVGVLRQSGPLLAALHEHEALMGMVMRDKEEPTTAAGVALRLLAVSDRAPDDLVGDEPVLLALVPPSIAAPVWPEAGRGVQAFAGGVPRLADPQARPAPGVLREALRLRARWTQELQATAVREIAARLVAQGRLADVDAIRTLHLDELLTLLREPNRRWRHAADREPVPTPLPTAFRFAEDGTAVAVTAPHARRRRRGTGGADLRGQGASAGRVEGVVVHDPAAVDGVPEGQAVLVVRTLAPGLAAHLPRLGGLIAETGSPLSHLAILAREHGVPAVVALHGALDAFTPGSRVVLDGRTGLVEAARPPGPPTDRRAAPERPADASGTVPPATAHRVDQAPGSREAA